MVTPQNTHLTALWVELLFADIFPRKISFSIYISHIVNFTRISTFLPPQKGVPI